MYDLRDVTTTDLQAALADLQRAWSRTRENAHTQRAGLSAALTAVEDELAAREVGVLF